MVSFFIPSSFFMVSLDMVSFFIVSLDIVSFFMPSSLPILSWAKAAGASARLSETAAADIPSAMRVLMVMGGHPLKSLKATDAAVLTTERRWGLLPAFDFFRVDGHLTYSEGSIRSAKIVLVRAHRRIRKCASQQ